MRIHTRLVLLVAGIVVQSGCTDTPTVIDAPLQIAPSFSMGGQGNGVVFGPNEFPEGGVIDADTGDRCIATLDEPLDNGRDFWLTDPRGNVSVHIVEHPVTLEVTLAASGALFVGRGTVTAHGDAVVPGVRGGGIAFLATGDVSDGSVTKRAYCKFIIAANGNYLSRTVRLR